MNDNTKETNIDIYVDNQKKIIFICLLVLIPCFILLIIGLTYLKQMSIILISGILALAAIITSLVALIRLKQYINQKRRRRTS